MGLALTFVRHDACTNTNGTRELCGALLELREKTNEFKNQKFQDGSQLLFRGGYQRGYDEGYNSRNSGGTRNGVGSILGSILGLP